MAEFQKQKEVLLSLFDEKRHPPGPVNHDGLLNFSLAQSSWCHDTWTSLSVVISRDVQTQLYCGLAILFNLSATWMSFSSTNISP